MTRSRSLFLSFNDLWLIGYPAGWTPIACCIMQYTHPIPNFLIFTLEQICNHDFKGISKLFPVVAVLLKFNILKTNCHIPTLLIYGI